jgi:ABC-type branched-subunit amino acid transport system ATPase component
LGIACRGPGNLTLTSTYADSSPILVDGLVVRFGGLAAVDGVSFAVTPGETFGLLGPNGAGKTTTVRVLTTLLPATEGRARVAGYDARTLVVCGFLVAMIAAATRAYPRAIL